MSKSHFPCPLCGHRIILDSDLGDTTVRCPGCEHGIPVPVQRSGTGQTMMPLKSQRQLPIWVGGSLLLCAGLLFLTVNSIPKPSPSGQTNAAQKAEPKQLFTFTVTSAETKDRYGYFDGVSHKGVSAMPGNTILVLSFTLTNEIDSQRRLSSEDIVVLDKNGKEVSKASLYGLLDSTPEGEGRTKLIRRWLYGAKSEVTAAIRGRLNDSASFIEWNLMPRQTIKETLVFIVPSATEGPLTAKLTLLENQAPPPPSPSTKHSPT